MAARPLDWINMPDEQVFEITQYELHTSRYRIRGTTMAEAIQKHLNGEGDMIDDSCEFVEVDTTRGMPFNEHAELGLSLQELGVIVEDVIPSIQDVRVVPHDELDDEDLATIEGL